MSRQSPFDEPMKKTRRRRHDVADARLPLGSRAVSVYDAFVAGIGFLEPTERSTLIVAGDEVLDNLVTHGEVGPAGIAVRVRKDIGRITLSILVESHVSFHEFARKVNDGQLPGPRYNTALGRWHGLGLTMCKNLASRILYRDGELTDRVFLEFDSDPVNPAR